MSLVLAVVAISPVAADEPSVQRKTYVPSVADERLEQFRDRIENETGGDVLRLEYIIDEDGKVQRDDRGRELLQVRIFKDGVGGDRVFPLDP